MRADGGAPHAHTYPSPLPSLERIAPYIQPSGLTPSRESARQSTPKTATAQDRGGGDTPRTRRRENREGKPKPCTMLLPNNAGEKKTHFPTPVRCPKPDEPFSPPTSLPELMLSTMFRFPQTLPTAAMLQFLWRLYNRVAKTTGRAAKEGKGTQESVLYLPILQTKPEAGGGGCTHSSQVIHANERQAREACLCGWGRPWDVHTYGGADCLDCRKNPCCLLLLLLLNLSVSMTGLNTSCARKQYYCSSRRRRVQLCTQYVVCGTKFSVSSCARRFCRTVSISTTPCFVAFLRVLPCSTTRQVNLAPCAANVQHTCIIIFVGKLKRCACRPLPTHGECNAVRPQIQTVRPAYISVRAWYVTEE